MNARQEILRFLAEFRDKFAVLDCGNCDFRKSCELPFDGPECKRKRVSIAQAFGMREGVVFALLDRIEALVRGADQFREVTKMVGNAAKLREALEYSIARAQEAMGYVFRSSGPKACMEELINVGREALAAPPRNCDRPECSTPKGAAQEWAKHCSAFADKDEECAGCLHQHQEPEAPCVVEWLLAPAAQEGGDHGE